MTSPDDWLTTAAAGRQLGVASTVVLRWVQAGRLRGRRGEDRWRIDPASVEQERQRIARASWWRRVDMPKGKAQGLQRSATMRLLKAASEWRTDTSDPDLTAALIAANDQRDALALQTRRAVTDAGETDG